MPDIALSRAQQVARTFVALADTLVTDFDIAETLNMLVERVVELLSASAAGVMLVAVDGTLEVMAGSSQRAKLLELFAAQTEDGPCVDCARGGAPVMCPDIRESGAAVAPVRRRGPGDLLVCQPQPLRGTESHAPRW